MQDFIGILALLMVTSWWLLLARVVQAETLVGEQQFWITRPYEWKKLLAAKVLFVAVWFGVPFGLTQLYLLAVAGFHPLAYVPGMLFTAAILGIVFLLPVWSVASVTSSFARLVLTVLGCFIVFVGFMYLIYGWPHGYTAANPYKNAVLFPLLVCGCVVAITLQYATRRAWVARGLLLAVSGLLAVSAMAYTRQSLVDRAYPAPAAGAAPVVAIAHTPSNHFPDKARTWEGEDYIDLPIHFSGVTDGYAVFTDDFRFSITAADGFSWTSPWQQTRERLRPGDFGSMISLMIKPELYDRFKAGPVTLQVEFAVSRYHADSVTKMTFPLGEVNVPGLGTCAPQLEGLESLACRSAIYQPRLTNMEMTWTHGDCSDPTEATAEGYSWFEPQTMEFSLTSVRTSFHWFRFEGSGEEPRREGHWLLCPGTPMTVAQYGLVDRTRVQMTMTNFVLPGRVDPT